ncbi:hypothetical protein O9993_07075 [Vibrio lentus]|nr:hypothetical protein [Vibrio lentus]
MGTNRRPVEQSDVDYDDWDGSTLESKMMRAGLFKVQTHVRVTWCTSKLPGVRQQRYVVVPAAHLASPYG